MNKEYANNYLNELKKAYIKTQKIKINYIELYNVYTNLLEGQQEKRSLKSMFFDKLLKKAYPKLDRQYLLKIKEINVFLQQTEELYKAMSYSPNMFDAKKACEQSINLLNKFSNMLEDLYDYVCSVYNIDNSQIKNSQLITK